ncbi:MAG: EamA/RhaT family transporter, partial [Pseudomonadota bacterium]
MRPADYFRLFLLAAIWGASFLFMRMIAPILGA